MPVTSAFIDRIGRSCCNRGVIVIGVIVIVVGVEVTVVGVEVVVVACL